MENPQTPEKSFLQKSVRIILWSSLIFVIGTCLFLFLSMIVFFTVPSFLAHQQLPEPYPDSQLIKITRGGAVCCLWDIYHYETDDSVEAVKIFLEDSMPGFRHPDAWWGKEDMDPKDVYINGRCDSSWLAEISRPDDFPNPCVGVDIYPNVDNGKTIIVFQATWPAP